jgi:hypothetical protein
MAEKIGVTSTKNDLLKAYTEIPANRSRTSRLKRLKARPNQPLFGN